MKEQRQEQMKELREKAAVLADALPYFRDFNQKIIVIGYLCSNFLNDEEEQRVMQDIALLKSVGMRPVIVHDSRIGADKFRENKRIAKLVELCGNKAVGICGVDMQTLHMILDHDYIPVVTPADIDTEMMNLNPMDTAREISVLLQAEKLIYVGRFSGIAEENIEKRILSVTLSELKQYLQKEPAEKELGTVMKNAVLALEGGVQRVHLISGCMQHALLLELFSVRGVGTVISI